MVAFPFDNNISMQIKGSDYQEELKVLQFHFHWGENTDQGSEHYMNAEKYPLEVR